MVESWVTDEMESVDLKDKRLNKQLTEVLSQLSARPTASIPAACGGDIYELMIEAQDKPANLGWIVRASQDRALAAGHAKDTEHAELGGAVMHHMRNQVLTEKVLFTQTIQVRGQKAKVSCEDRCRLSRRTCRRLWRWWRNWGGI